MHRSLISYLLLFFFFFVAIAHAQACEHPTAVADPAPGHACCIPAAGDGDMAAGKIPTWLRTLDCYGNLCCGNAGGVQPAAAIPTMASDHVSLQRSSVVVDYLLSFPPVAASGLDQPPLIRFPPLYLRNCAFLI